MKTEQRETDAERKLAKAETRIRNRTRVRVPANVVKPVLFVIFVFSVVRILKQNHGKHRKIPENTELEFLKKKPGSLNSRFFFCL